jgi:tight adherence protein C
MTSELVILALFFVFVLGTVALAGYWMVNRSQPEGPSGQKSAGPKIGDPEKNGFREAVASIFGRLGEWIPSSESSRQAMSKRLALAGYRGISSPTVYFGAKCASALLLALILALGASGNKDAASTMFAAGVCGLGLGFLIPERVLDVRIRARSERLRRALPSAIDLMVMALEAGQSLDQSMLLASRNLHSLYPELSREIGQVFLETRASKSRADALRHMAERNGEPELRKLALLLMDSDRFGGSLAPILRQHAKFLRTRFKQRAQEAARKLSVKIVFPVFFLIFPSIMVITLGPAVITIFSQFSKFMGH